MEEDILCLKWNKHSSTLTNLLEKFREKELFTDATLTCEGEFFSVHKLILSMCSDYFSKVFEKASCKSPVVIIKGIKSKELEILLDYMYRGEVNVRQDELSSVIKAAECLEIKGLAGCVDGISDYDTFEKLKNAKASSSEKELLNSTQTNVSEERLEQKVADGDDKVSTSRTGSSLLPVGTIKEECMSGDERPNDYNINGPPEQGIYSESKDAIHKEDCNDQKDGPSQMQDNNSMDWGDAYSSAHNNTSEEQEITPDLNSYASTTNRESYERFCNICRKWMKKQNFLKHERTHTGEKPHACHICSYRSCRKDNLDIHMRKHTGEKPFACPHCQYCSTRSSRLKMHIYTKHRNI